MKLLKRITLWLCVAAMVLLFIGAIWQHSWEAFWSGVVMSLVSLMLLASVNADSNTCQCKESK